jgi:hypothetical protein
MKTTLGRIQNGILTNLAGWGKSSATQLALYIYGLYSPTAKVEAQPTESQIVSVRRALRALEREDVVRPTKYFRNGERCWELTGKSVPAPEKKKRRQSSKPRLSVVSPE